MRRGAIVRSLRVLRWVVSGLAFVWVARRVFGGQATKTVSGSEPVYRSTPFWRVYGTAAQLLDHKVGWWRVPKPLGLAALVGLRNTLRQRNLYDTETAPREAPPLPRFDVRVFVERTADGTYNDLSDPEMGRAGARFGRNVPI